jgi:hypothetical protein
MRQLRMELPDLSSLFRVSLYLRNCTIVVLFAVQNTDKVSNTVIQSVYLFRTVKPLESQHVNCLHCEVNELF